MRSQGNCGGWKRVAKTDYERTMEQFRSQLTDVWNKRKIDQLRSQIDDVRHNVDELVRSYNRVMGTATDMLGETQRRMAKQARESLEGAAEGVSEGRSEERRVGKECRSRWS